MTVAHVGVPKNRGPNIDPKVLSSYDKDTRKKDPQSAIESFSAAQTELWARIWWLDCLHAAASCTREDFMFTN